MDLSGGRVKGPGGQGRAQESESPWKTSRSSSLGWAEPRLALAPPNFFLLVITSPGSSLDTIECPRHQAEHLYVDFVFTPTFPLFSV